MKLFSRAQSLFLLLVVCAWALCVQAADEKPAAAAEKKPLPSAREVLERYSKAIGGKDAFMKHNSQHAIGTMGMPAQQANGKMEVFAARPNKLIMKVQLPGAGEMTTGFDGNVAWMSTALTGTMLLEGKMRDQIATQADFDQSLHDPAHYSTMEVLGIEKFNGEDCYKVHLVHRTGFDTTEFFSTKTGLQRGFSSTQESPFGPVKSTTEVTDYKQFGKLFLPSRIVQKAMGVESVMTIDEMEFDNVDPSVFELPADVKGLIKDPPANDKPAAEAKPPGKSGQKN